MNTIHKILLPLLSLMLMVSGCQSKDTAEVLDSFINGDDRPILFDKSGGTAKISIIASSSDWEIRKGYPEWVKPFKEGRSLHISTLPNEEGAERLATLTVGLGSATKSFTIRQYGQTPQLRVEEVEHVFKKDGGEVTIDIFVNGSLWTVSKVHDAPWLTYEVDVPSKKLTIKVSELHEDEEGGKDSRRASLVISNGDKHIRVNVTQLGWQQFTEGMANMIGKTRQEIIDIETALGHERDLESEKMFFYPQGEEGDKAGVVFKTPAQQTTRTVYYFDYNTDLCYDYYYKAEKDQIFDIDMLEEWVKSQGFKKGEVDTKDPNELYYYKDNGDESAYYEVINKKDAPRPTGFMPLSAYIRYDAFSNQIAINPVRRQILNFPIRNSARFYDVKYGLKELIEYEKQFGMKLDYNHDNTVKCKLPGYQDLYESVAFVPEVPSKEVGARQLSVYYFNIPGVLDESGKPASDISHDPALAGSVGRRTDIYAGASLAYRVRGLYTLNPAFQKAHRRAGFLQAVGDASYGIYYFIRGVEDVAYTQVLGDNFSLTYFRSKSLVDLYREHLNSGK